MAYIFVPLNQPVWRPVAASHTGRPDVAVPELWVSARTDRPSGVHATEEAHSGHPSPSRGRTGLRSSLVEKISRPCGDSTNVGFSGGAGQGSIATATRVPSGENAAIRSGRPR